MKITYTNSKEYVLMSAEETFLGSLKFEKWSSTKAQITTQYGEFFDVASENFWSTTIGIKKNDTTYAQLKMNWKGQIVIDLTDNGKGVDYVLKSNSIWKKQYVLQDRDENELLIINADYKWSKWDYEFNISVNPEFTNVVDETLVLIATYGILYLIMISAAAAS